MLFKSPVFTQVSGSIGGTTFSHNRGGLYTRSRTVPVNPSSPAQNAVRGRFATLMSRWTNVLTQDNRDDWDVYSLNVPLPDPFGDPRNVGGVGMYIRGNTLARQAGAPFVNPGPGIFSLAEFTDVTGVGVLAAGNLISFTFDNTDAWANEDEGFMMVYASRPQQPAKNYFTGPYRFADQIDGDGVTPPTSPASIASAFSYAVGQRVFIRIIVVRADGRVSNVQRVTAIVT